MPKFRFGLQKVMQHRKTVEDLAQRDFQEAQAELHRQNEILIGMHQAIEEARKVAFTKQTMVERRSRPLVRSMISSKGRM